MKEYWDRDFYNIEERDGEKVILFLGYTYESGCGDDEENGKSCRELEYSGFESPLKEFLIWRNDPDEYMRRAEEVTQYIGDCTPEVAKENMDCGAIELKFSDITMDTPCGFYVDV